MGGYWGWRGHRWLALIIRLYLAGIFLVAWYGKVRDPGLFGLQVAAYQILPVWAIKVVVVLLPLLELTLAVLLIVGMWVRSAAALIGALLLVFMLAAVIAMAKGLELSCGCFSGAEEPLAWDTLARDGGWLLLATYVVAVDREPLGLLDYLRRRWGIASE